VIDEDDCVAFRASRIYGTFIEHAGRRTIAITYENPVHSGIIDSSPVFVHRHGEQVECEPSEREHHPDADEAIVVWRSAQRPRPSAQGLRMDFDIIVTNPGCEPRSSSTHAQQWVAQVVTATRDGHDAGASTSP